MRWKNEKRVERINVLGAVCSTRNLNKWFFISVKSKTCFAKRKVKRALSNDALIVYYIVFHIKTSNHGWMTIKLLFETRSEFRPKGLNASRLSIGASRRPLCIDGTFPAWRGYKWPEMWRIKRAQTVAKRSHPMTPRAQTSGRPAQVRGFQPLKRSWHPCKMTSRRTPRKS